MFWKTRVRCLIEMGPAKSGGRQIPALRLQSRLQEEAQSKSSEAAELLREVGQRFLLSRGEAPPSVPSVFFLKKCAFTLVLVPGISEQPPHVA